MWLGAASAMEMSAIAAHNSALLAQQHLQGCAARSAADRRESAFDFMAAAGGAAAAA